MKQIDSIDICICKINHIHNGKQLKKDKKYYYKYEPDINNKKYVIIGDDKELYLGWTSDDISMPTDIFKSWFVTTEQYRENQINKINE